MLKLGKEKPIKLEQILYLYLGLSKIKESG